MKELTLKREICDTLAIIAVVSGASLLGQAWPIRILLACCFAISIIEITVTSYRKDRECYPTKADILFTAPMTIALLVAIALIICVRLDGKEYLLILGLAMASDAGGLIFGRFFGYRHPSFSKRISPNKTWAGYLGSFICTLCVGVLGLLILCLPWNFKHIVIILLSSSISSAGDLLGSGTKRELGIKHSSDYTNDLPVLKQLEVLMRSRHGYLDCMDSVSFMVIAAMILFA